MLARSTQIHKAANTMRLALKPTLAHYLCAIERIQEKWTPVFRPNARQNKDLEYVNDSIFCERALEGCR